MRNDQTPAWAHRMLELMTAIRDHVAPSRISDRWTAQTFTLPSGQSKVIGGHNEQRARAVIFTDSNNTTPVWIGPSSFFGTDVPQPGDGFVPLGPGSLPYEVKSPGEIHAWSSSGGHVSIHQEFRR